MTTDKAALKAQIKELREIANGTSCGDGNFERSEQRSAERKANELQARLDAMTIDKAALVENIKHAMTSSAAMSHFIRNHADEILAALTEPAPTDAEAHNALEALKALVTGGGNIGPDGIGMYSSQEPSGGKSTPYVRADLVPAVDLGMVFEDLEQKQYIPNMMILMFIMGFQGGTIQQCAEYLGTTPDDILYATPGRMEDLMRQAQLVRNKRNSPAYPVKMAAYPIESAPMDGTPVIVMLFGDDGAMRWASKARYLSLIHI